MIRLLHIADVHLGARFSAFGDLAGTRREQVLGAFRALPERVRELQVDALLVAGDLFDAPDPPGELRAAVAETLRRVSEAGAAVLVVPGNHDAITIRPNPWGGDLGGAHIFRDPHFTTHAIRLDSGELRVHGAAFDPVRCPDPLSTLQAGAASGWDVALLHASVQGAPHWKAGPNSLSVEAAQLSALPVSYVAIGDHHRFRAPEEFPDGAACCYPGSFAAVDLTETGPKGAVLVRLQDDGRISVDQVDSGLTPVESVGPVDVTTLADHDAVVAAVIDRIGDREVMPRVGLHGTPAFPLDPAVVREHLVERYGFATVEDGTRFYDSGRLTELADDDTIAGHLVREGRRRIDAASSDSERRTHEHALRLALSALEVM